jgi:AraC-like DNA-binding protein
LNVLNLAALSGGMAEHDVMRNGNNIRFWRPGRLDGVELFRASKTRYCFPKHFHDTYSVRLLEAGAVESLYYGRRNVLTAGDIDVLEPAIVHTASAASKQGWSCRCLYISREFLQYSALDFGATRLPPLQPLLARNERLLFLRLRWAHHRLETDGDELEGETLLTGALAALVERLAGRPHKIVQEGHEPRHVSTIRSFLDEHYDSRVSLADLARTVELNPVYLVRSFRQHTGLPPHAYQKQMRLNRACRMLQSATPASEVACAVGFADQSHLTRVFKQLMGVTPAQYARGL